MLAKKINEALYSFGDNYFEISVDYGCGHRPYLDAIERISRESIGVDVDENDIADIRIEPEKPIPLKSGAVDLVTSFQVLEHVKNYQFYLAECSRICKKGGTFVLSAPSIWPYHPHPQDMRRWMIDGLVYDVRASGFEVDRVYAVLNPIATSLQYFLSVFYYEMLRHGDLGRVLYKIAALIVNPNIIVCEYMFRKTERFGSGNYLIVAHRC